MSDVKSVIEQKCADRIHGEYVHYYKERYGIEPLFESIDDVSVFIWLVKKVGEDRARDMVRTYISMDGDNAWFAKNAHSLQVLRKNANVVSAAVGAKNKNKFSHEHYGVWFLGSCDGCFKEARITCAFGQIVDWTHLCDECKKKGIKPRHWRQLYAEV